MSSAMNAVRAHKRGGPEVLVYEKVPTPTPGVGDVLIEVHAAGITFAELTWEETWTRGGRDRTPVIPSHEFCGMVASAGDAVRRWSVGDWVYGLIPFDQDGAAAEYVVVPADRTAAKPMSVTAVEAAALPLPALTARQALFTHARLTAGERVLVQGGAGAVGGYAVQLAAAAGADVTATTVGAVDYVKGLGADEVVDISCPGEAGPAGVFDVVIDTVSGETLNRSYELLRPGGRLVTLQTPPDQQRAAERRITAIFFVVTADTAALTELAALVDAGTLRVTVAATFPLSDARTAYASGARTGRAPGKTVLTVRPAQ